MSWWHTATLGPVRLGMLRLLFELISAHRSAILNHLQRQSEVGTLAARHDLEDWVYDALRHHGGEASVLEVSKYIWAQHEHELRVSGNLFYSWQYDMRWAAKMLRDKGKLAAADLTPRGKWVLR